MSHKVAVFGASGNIGSAIVRELSSRGKYDITAIARNADKIPDLPKVTAVSADVSKPEAVAPHIDGVDAVFSALFFDVPPATLVKEAKDAGAERLLVVGGAGSLHVSEGGPLLVDTPEFPEEYKELGQAGLKFLQDFKKITDFDWTFFSPAMIIGPGERKGTYRLGTDVLVVDAEGNSSISYDDYALAFVDELEKHKFSKARFTAAY